MKSHLLRWSLTAFVVMRFGLGPGIAFGNASEAYEVQLPTEPLSFVEDDDDVVPVPVPVLPDATPGTLDLTLREVFNQKGTNWCWAYSAFHALRSYFTHLPDSVDPDVETFRAVVRAIKSDGEFRALMRKYVSTGTKGSPYQFLNILKKDKNLKKPGEWDNLEGSREKVMKQAVSNLRKGIPAAYCYGGHCVMIYGFTTDGTKVTQYSIADSVGPRRYKKSAKQVQGDYWAMWTLPGESATNEPSEESEAVDPYRRADRGRDGLE
jgi:hypothetical protein